jgi:hypothetical protein
MVAADRIRGLLQEQRLLLGLMRQPSASLLGCGVKRRSQWQELAVHEQDEEGDDLDRQIPSSSCGALLEMVLISVRTALSCAFNFAGCSRDVQRRGSFACIIRWQETRL